MKRTYFRLLAAGSVLACLALCGQRSLAVDETPPPGTVMVVLTAKGTSDRMTEKPAVMLAARGARTAGATIEIDPAVKFQEIEGFGGAFTEASADAFPRSARNTGPRSFRPISIRSRAWAIRCAAPTSEAAISH